MTIRGVRLPVGAIIGIVAGGAAFLAILATVLVLLLRRYLRKRYARRRDPLVHKWEQHQSDSSLGLDQASAATTSVKASSIKLMDKNTTDSTSEVVENVEESIVEEGEPEDNASVDARYGSV